jgi:hypothetical protein
LDENTKGNMQAKTLPEGICNFPIRMTTAEHQLWGKFTYELNRVTGGNQSVGDVMRQALAKGAEQMDALLASQIKAVRDERLRMKRGVACLIVIAFAIFAGGSDLRMARTFRVRSGSARVSRKEV